MLFKIFKNRLFYLGFITILLASIFFREQKVFGFRRFPADIVIKNKTIGNLEYINKKEISNTIVGIIYTSMKYGDNELSSNIINVKIDNISDLMIFIQKLKSESKISLKSLLRYSSNKKTSLTLYQKSITKLISQSKGIIPSLKNFIKQHKIKYRNCEIGKKTADGLYTKGIKNGQEGYIQGGYKDAKEYGVCETEERIIINAYSPLLEEINKHYQKLLLQQKFIKDNWTILISNYKLLEGDNLQNLIKVKNELK